MGECGLACMIWIFGLVYAFSLAGKLIYGGVYWGSLKFWDGPDSPDWTDHLWLISLLQWIFSLVLPIGDIVCVCMIIYSTSGSRCNVLRTIEFGEDMKYKISTKYRVNFSDELSVTKYMNARCKLPNSLFITFLVCYLVGGPLSIIPKFCMGFLCLGLGGGKDF